MWKKLKRRKCKDCGVGLTSENGYVVEKAGRLYFHTYCKKCNRKRRNDWSVRFPEKVQEQNRTQNLRRYGIDPGWFEAKLVEQDRKCGICGTFDFGGRRPHVDHDHETNKARGLLCGPCNKALERVETVPDWPVLALDYLAKYV